MTLEVKDQRSRRLLFAMIFGLLLLNVGLIYKLITKSDQLNETTTELQSTSADLEELQLLEAELRVNLAEKTGQNAQLDSIIGIRDAELQAKVAEIRKMLKSGKLTAAKAKSEIANLRGEIEALTAEIERLSKENQYLKDENYVIQKQVEAEQEKVAEMVVVNTELTKQVAVGSRIFFKALDVLPLRDAVFGDFKTTDKISKLKKIDVNYVIANNDLASKGEKMLYFQVITPNKSTLHNSSAGSGTFNFEGSERMYTVKKGVNFQNSNEKGSVSIPKTDGMSAGKYILNVFSDDHKMGSSEFTLK
jgi:archaellum component FlaC|tara:strand:+ start:885 stop:1799 length:915 start_codon:yes stop_codon:yes gene_type:complete